ncbi:MAG TPA: DUF1189 family protein [Alphaproteobacteria bacterium]
MKKYLKALYESFGQVRFYHEAIYQWTGSALAYLLVLATLVSIALAVQLTITIQTFNQQELPHLLQQWPKITLQEGEVIMTVPQPYKITSRSGTTLIYIDTTKNETELGKEKAALLVGKDFVLNKRSDNNVQKTDLSKFKSTTYVMDRAKIENFFTSFTYAPFIALPIILCGQWLMLLAMTIVAGTLSYVVTAYMKEEFDFETRMRIGAVALTPPFIINQLLHIFTTYSMGVWITLILWLLHMYVIILGARAYQSKLDVTA